MYTATYFSLETLLSLEFRICNPGIYVPASPTPTNDQKIDAFTALVAKREKNNKPADPMIHEIEYNFLASNVSVKLTKKGVATTYPI